MSRFLFCAFLLLTATFCIAEVVEEVVAKVGNEIITKSDYDAETARLRDVLSRSGVSGDQLEKQFEQQKKSLLDFMIDNKLLEQRAKELNINVDEEVQAAIERLKQENNIPDDHALEEALTKEGSSLAQLKDDFHKRVIQQKILWNYVQGKVNITEDELKAYYENHKSEVMSPASVKITRFIVSQEGADNATLKTEADSVATDLRAGKELKDGDYPHLKVSDSADLEEKDLNPKFVEALKNVAAGSFTDPIETSNGWSILKVESRTESKPVSYEDARGQIYQTILQERADKYQKSFLEDLRKHSYVEIIASVS